MKKQFFSAIMILLAISILLSSCANGSNAGFIEDKSTENESTSENDKMVSLFESLISGYKCDLMSYIPSTMRSDYSPNLVNAADIVEDYSSGVDTSKITYGFGEQWNMVLESLTEAESFFDALKVVDVVSSASVAAFRNYISENPNETASYSFKEGIYDVNIKFDGETISYVLNYVADFEALGEQSAQIALSMNSTTGERFARIQLGDANAMSYKMTENSYEFAIKYLDIKRSICTIEKNSDGSVSGKLFEFLAVKEFEVTSSVAEFYITESYASVAGNKVNDMLGFKEYICELYTTADGKMCACEINQTLSEIKYNSLWFNLDDISGIDSLKYIPKNDDADAKLYINDSANEWKNMKIGGFSLKALSRRFDIEFRTQYVYSYDSEGEEYIAHEIQAPMLFVEAENYETLVKDVKDTNGVDISVDVDSEVLDKLIESYEKMIPDLKENKENISAEYIVEYIGTKILV